MKDNILTLMKSLVNAVIIIWASVSWCFLLSGNRPDCSACSFDLYFVYIPAGLGALCLLCTVVGFFLARYKFDWYLINGKFIVKVVCLVLLVPLIFFAILKYGNSDTGISASDLIQSKDEHAEVAGNVHKEDNLFWTIFVHYIDPGLQIEVDHESGARNWSAGIAVLGLFLMNGLLISSLIAWGDKRKEKWLNGETKYWSIGRLFKHYVIIGGNDMAHGIVKQILASSCRFRKILILTSRDVNVFRRELDSMLYKESDKKRIIIYYGNRDAEPDIRQLNLKNAKEVYLIGEDTRTDDIESYHDTLNMKCMQLINGYCQEAMVLTKYLLKIIGYYDRKLNNTKKSTVLEKRYKAQRALFRQLLQRRRILCRVLFEYQTTFSVFQFSEISNAIKNHVNFKPFNYYEMWAQKVLVSRNLDDCPDSAYLPLEGKDGIHENSKDFVHLVIVGMSRMGTALAIEAAHLAHYPNYEKYKIRTKITFIDLNAEQERKFFMGRFRELFSLSNWRYGCVGDKESAALKWDPWHHPYGYKHLGGDFLDVEWEFINGGIEDESVQAYLKEASAKTPKMTIAMCVPEASKCLAHALYLERDIYMNVLQILVYNRYDDALIEEMINHSVKQYNPFQKKIKAFGMAAHGYDAQSIEEAEYIAEQFNIEYGRIYDYLDKAGRIVDEGKGKGKSEVAKWWSNIYCANMLWTKLRCMDLNGREFITKRQLDVLSRVEHNRWNMEQLLLRCRPLTQDEQNDVISRKVGKNDLKGDMAHFDLCSNKRLVEIDNISTAYDRAFSTILLRIYNDLLKRFPTK